MDLVGLHCEPELIQIKVEPIYIKEEPSDPPDSPELLDPNESPEENMIYLHDQIKQEDIQDPLALPENSKGGNTPSEEDSSHSGETLDIKLENEVNLSPLARPENREDVDEENEDEPRKIREMAKSRAKYMRDYRQKKREEKLKSGNMKAKKIARNSTQRSRDFRARARAANSIVCTPIVDETTNLPNMYVSHPTSLLSSLPFSSISCTSTVTVCNTGPVENNNPSPADVEQGISVAEMGKSRAKYMRDYRKKKREEKLKMGKLKPKKIVCNSTQHSRGHRAFVHAANSILSYGSTADSSTTLPNLFTSHPTSALSPLLFPSSLSTSPSTTCNTGPAKCNLLPADVEEESVVQKDVKKLEHIVHNSTIVTEMGKSRAKYMRDYRQKKREEKLKIGKIKPKKIARNSTQRSRDQRARARVLNSTLSYTSTADKTTTLPNLFINQSTSLLSPLPFSTVPMCNTDPVENSPHRLSLGKKE